MMRLLKAAVRLLLLISIAYHNNYVAPVTLRTWQLIGEIPYIIADLKFIFSFFKANLWIIEVDLRKWDQRG